jgi:hypothetical protein
MVVLVDCAGRANASFEGVMDRHRSPPIGSPRDLN